MLAASSLVILLLLASLVDWGNLGAVVREAAPFPLFAAFLLTLFFPVLNALRWLAVVRATGEVMSFGRSFRITMACWPVGTLTPGKAGEMLKGAALSDRTAGLGTVFTERVIDVAVLGVYGVLFGALAGSLWAVVGGLVGLGGAAFILLGARAAIPLLGEKKLAGKLRAFLAVSPMLFARPRLLVACVLASALNWFLSMAQLWFLLLAFGAPAPWVLIVGILPAATFAGLLPLTIAGAGTRDSALLLLAAGRIDAAALLASSIAYTLLGYFFLGVAGLPFLGALTRQEQPRQR